MSLTAAVQDLLNRGDIPWKKVIVGLTLGQFAFETYLSYRQYRKLSEAVTPREIEGLIDEETMEKSRTYSKAKLRFGLVSDLFSLGTNLAVIKYDLLPRIWNAAVAVGQHMPAFLAPASTISQSIYFALAIHLLTTLQSLPLGYYQNFVLEEKFGFNKSTVGLWVTDTVKSFLLVTGFLVPVSYLFLKIIDVFSTGFISYVCTLLLVLQIVLVALQPLLSAIFNTFTPLEDGELKDAIVALSKRVNFPLEKILVSDGSRRSAHSNAYFTGLPFLSKRIVLFDTLIKGSTVEEVVAVMCHEIGHWKLNHILQRLLVSQATTLFTLTFFSALYVNTSLYEAFGFFVGPNPSSDSARVVVGTIPVFVGFLLFNDVFQPANAALQFIVNLLMQRQELQADEFAKKLGYQDAMGSALILLARENLGSPDLDKLYSAYHSSHPSMVERLRALQYKPAKKQ
ncbi:AaceriABR163Wp [[Ashbya] aceris (nom. inval.)]|nr:AaceriABR163Wp [[Ashbya] aceris (nom. inval.)]